jgi:hypothetical protein
VTKDTRTKRTVETTYTPADFLAALADRKPLDIDVPTTVRIAR